MAYTFVLAQGGNVGNSLIEKEMVPRALGILKKAEEKGVEVFLPLDSVVADSFSADANAQNCATSEMPEGWMGLDIGPDSAERFAEAVRTSKTILWNGPMGVFEFDKFSNGTFTVARALKKATDLGGYTLIGGGDSVAAINAAKLADQVSYVSTGGGAMLEYLEGKILPGISAMAE